MKVSVVIATYRRKDSLREAIFSVLSQTWESIEIIVVDDNADEDWNTAVQEVVYSFSDIIYLRCEENKGSAEARNIGIRAALGEYITFLDDDDVYLPEKITHQMAVMVSERADYCITDIALYGEGGDRLIEKRVRRYIKSTEPRELLRYHFMYHMTGTDTMMFRKEYILSFGGFARGNVGDEFYLMERAILAGGRFAYAPYCDVRAYVHYEQPGLSAGQGKIEGENALFHYKKQRFDLLDGKAKAYIRCRHYAVLAFAYLRMKQYGKCMVCCIRAFVRTPVQSVKILISR